jgi:selenium metabolism protein YedF
MSETILDCKGLACPQPVLQCKECLEKDNPPRLAVVVDNEAARQNVTRFLAAQGYAVESEAANGDFRLEAVRQGGAPEAAQDEACECGVMSPAELAALQHKTLVFLTADTVGHGDDALGRKLMANFLSTLPELGEELWRIILLNSGVRLAAAGSPVLGALRALEQSGVSILVCGTCLDHFGLLEQKEVGETTNMLDVVTSLHLASKVIKP